MPIKTFLLEDTPLHAEEVEFNVIKPGFWSLLLTLIMTLISLFLAFVVFTFFSGGELLEYAISIGIVIVTIIITPILYNGVGMKVLRETIIESYKTWNEEDKIQTRWIKFIIWLIGVKYYPKHKFYVQARAYDLDLGKTYELIKSRIMDILSMSIGMTFGILTLLDFFIAMTGEIFIYFIFAIFVTPILTFLIIPLIWTLKDSNLRAINEDGTLDSIGEQASNSVLSTILGLQGLILGFSFLLDYVNEINELEALALPTYLLYIIAALDLGLFILLSSGVCLLIGFIYLILYHKKNVNLFRAELIAEGIPLGIPMVQKADQSIVNRITKLDTKSK